MIKIWSNFVEGYNHNPLYIRSSHNIGLGNVQIIKQLRGENNYLKDQLELSCYRLVLRRYQNCRSFLLLQMSESKLYQTGISNNSVSELNNWNNCWLTETQDYKVSLLKMFNSVLNFESSCEKWAKIQQTTCCRSFRLSPKFSLSGSQTSQLRV